MSADQTAPKPEGVTHLWHTKNGEPERAPVAVAGFFDGGPVFQARGFNLPGGAACDWFIHDDNGLQGDGDWYYTEAEAQAQYVKHLHLKAWMYGHQLEKAQQRLAELQADA